MIDPTDLHALADGELSKAEMARLRESMKSDPRSEAEFNAILNLKDCLRDRSTKFVEEECWRACVGRLNELDKSKKVEFIVGKYSWALCGVFFALILGGRFAFRNIHGDSATTADLSRVIPTFGPRSSTATPEQTQVVKGLIDDALGAVESRLKVAGISHGAFQGQDVTRVDLRDNAGPLELFVIPANVNFEDATQATEDPNVSVGVIAAPQMPSGRVNCLIWNSHGNTLVLAAPRSPEALENVVSTQMRP